MRPADPRQALSRPVDVASLAMFRIMLGTLLTIGLVRIWTKGLIASSYIEPTFFFPYYGLSWLPAPGEAAHAVFAALIVLALCVTAGAFTRASAALFCLLFTYVHFLDATYYLNHYYLVSLLTGLLACSPAGNLWSVDARRAPVPPAQHMPFWVLALFRAQVGAVYFFAGLEKLRPDWLLHGEPLRTWLAANAEIPLLGTLFVQPWCALVMSWFGAAYDLTIPLWLSLRRTRPYAYIAVVAFHLITARLFEIGMFPYLMITNSLLFLSPSWPRRFLGGEAPAPAPMPLVSRTTLGVLALYACIQLALPLRRLVYPGNTLWSEQGYRFAWHVMLIEKTGSTEFRVVDRQTGKTRVVFPRSQLTRSQVKAMATQPDMILAFAHHLAERERAEGHDVAVYADAYAVLNGRAPARLIDPEVDLTTVHDGLCDKPWIMPAPRR